MSEFALPETRYALSGDVNIAYQVMGAGRGHHHGPRRRVAHRIHP
jgi:hypothetical protein